MTGQEMIESFGLNYASEINSSVPGFETSEIVSFLNQAQDDIILMLCEARNWSKIEALRNKKLFSYITDDTYISNSKQAAIDFNYFWIANTYAKAVRDSSSTTSSSWIECRDFSTRKDDLNRYIENDFNKPVFEIPIWYKDGDVISVIHDSYSTVTNIMSEYIKIPTAIANDTNSSEVDKSYHGKIVDRAVTIAIETLSNPRIATQPQVAI